MHIAITGGTGFLGRYIVRHLIEQGYTCRCWYRPQSDRGGFDGIEDKIEWMEGGLRDPRTIDGLVRGADAVVHAALDRPGPGFMGAEGDVADFVQTNVVGSVRLIQAAISAGADRFIFISTCAVHDVILEDRKLDEAHPLWPKSHYGAHKAAIEKFVHSFGLGHGYPVCALRPTGIYGLARPAKKSKWYDLAHAVRRGESIASSKGGKEVHAADVAKATALLLTADGIAGQSYNCYDMYIADQDVAQIAKEITGSTSEIEKSNKGPRHQIDTTKIRNMGMTFGGSALLEQTIRQMLETA